MKNDFTYKSGCVLILRRDGKVLATSRRYDDRKWGMPGGRSEDGEEMRDTAVRELREETGLSVDPSSLHILYTGRINEWVCNTYLLPMRFEHSPYSVQEPTQREKGIYVEWKDWADLLTGPFADYNHEILRKLISVGMPLHY